MIDQSPKLMMYSGSGSNFDKPIFYSQPLGITNHINGVVNYNGSYSGLQVVGSAGFVRVYRSPTDTTLVYNTNTSYDLYSSAVYTGPVFGSGYYAFATGSSGSFFKNSNLNRPAEYVAAFQRIAISGQTGGISRTFLTTDDSTAIVFGGAGRISKGESLNSASAGPAFVAKNSGTTQTLNAGAYGHFWTGDYTAGPPPNQMMIIVGTNGAFTISDVGETWTASRFRTSTATMNGVACGDGTVVAVGSGGTIFACNTDTQVNPSLTLTNPNAWTQCVSPTTLNLRAVCAPHIDPYRAGTSTTMYGAKRKFWIAVGDGGVILSSPDGFNWTQCVSPTTAQLNCVVASTYFGSYVIGGQNGTFLVGNDGT